MQEILLATASSPDGGKSDATPIVAADRIGGFLVGWGGHLGHQSFDVERYAAPWSTKPTALGFQLEPRGRVMQISPSGKFLAVGHARGNWQATLYDLDQQTLIRKIDHIRVCSGVDFTPNEAMLISRSQGVQLLLVQYE